MGRNFIIAGAGISGLTLALALAKFGASITVLERSDGLQAFGAGLQISPNARRVLDSLGLGDEIGANGLEPKALDVYSGRAARPVVSLELGPLMRERFGAPYTVMHRADLASALYVASRRFANIDINFGVTDWTVETQDRGVGVSIKDSATSSRTMRAQAFIGADGVHSQTRQRLLGGPPPQFGGRIAWRALAPAEALKDLIALDRVSVFFSAGHHLVCYPLPHREQINLALFSPARHGDAPDTQPPINAVRGRGAEVVRAANADWTAWPLYTVTTDTWYRGNVAIIGDAAHAMLPFQAQGAAMGIEDAAVLAPLLAESDDPADAFARWSHRRQDRVRKVAALSASNGRIFHMRWPLTLARDAVMRFQGSRAHLNRLGWVYDYDTASASVGS